jgi:hypothetical protein
MIGAGDLGDNGVWRVDPVYGAVWVPARVPVGWAPYRYGHWAFVRPWGWTWIDDMPWGFAPFHYGRWAVVGGGGWVWVPGAMVARPVYAPAMVAFVGGSGFSMAIGVGGGVGVAAWVPLGPREVYRPYYHVSDAYVRNVNVTHVTNVNVVNVTNVTYVNRTYVTAVPQAAFTGARPVAAASVRVPPEAIGRAQTMSTMDVRPVRESYMGRAAQPGQRFGAPPAQVMQRQVVVKQAPPESVRPMGGVRVAAPPRQFGSQPGQPANNAPQPQVQSTRPLRNDRPPAVNNTPQPENARPRRPIDPTAPTISRPPATNATTPQPQVQHQQPASEQHNQRPQREKTKNDRSDKKEEKKQ